MRNIRLQYTCWDELPPDLQSFFYFMLGADAARGRAFYDLYYLWFNIPHEIAHVLREQYGMKFVSRWEDEIAVTAFAAAYWHERGEQRRLDTLSEMLRAILRRIPDPVPRGENRGGYFDLNYETLVNRATAFCHYLYSIALAAIESPSPWHEVLSGLIMPEANEAFNPPTGPYAAVNTMLPLQIVTDLREYLLPHGIRVPHVAVESGFQHQIQFATWDE